jgi:hypothetical protein
MAGGYSVVVAGTTITASRENQYVSRQVITRHASASARNSSISTAAEEGMYSDLADTDQLERYNGSIWATPFPTLRAVKYYTGDITSTGTEVAMVAWTGGDSSVTFVAGHLYRIELHHNAWNKGTAGYFADHLVKVRRDVNSTSALQLGSWRVCAGGGSSPIVNHLSKCYVHNAGSDVTVGLGLTVTKMTGGDAVVSTATIEVWDMGASAAFSSAQITALGSTAIS